MNKIIKNKNIETGVSENDQSISVINWSKIMLATKKCKIAQLISCTIHDGD